MLVRMKISFLRINQSNSGGFIEKSQREEELPQFLDMNVFEELYQIANDEIRELSFTKRL